MSEENKYILQVKDLHTSFATDAGEVRAVNGVSFNLEPGKTLGIVGESGSGKSVTSYSIMQILAESGKITGGEVLYRGEDISKWNEKQMQKFRGGKVLDHFPGSDDKPESGIYDWKSVDGGNSAPHRQG